MKITNKIKVLTITGLIVVLGIIGQVAAQTVWLDELGLSTATQGYGIPMKNKSLDGKTLTIAGKTFNRGFATHSVSSLLILLEGKATSFNALVGMDDEVKGHGAAAEFELYGDGKPVLLSSIKRNYKLGKHDEEERPMLSRLALHSYRLKFTDAEGKEVNLVAELPKDMRALLHQLKKNK